MNQQFLIPILAGVVLSIPYLAWSRRTVHRPLRAWSAGLVVAAALYVVFAAARGRTDDLLLEILGLLLFTFIAIAGMRYWPQLLAVGWVAHVAWDLYLHPVADGGYAPWWYPLLCVGFDLFVAGFIASSFWGRGRVNRWIERRSGPR